MARKLKIITNLKSVRESMGLVGRELAIGILGSFCAEITATNPSLRWLSN